MEKALDKCCAKRKTDKESKLKIIHSKRFFFVQSEMNFPPLFGCFDFSHFFDGRPTWQQLLNYTTMYGHRRFYHLVKWRRVYSHRFVVSSGYVGITLNQFVRILDRRTRTSKVKLTKIRLNQNIGPLFFLSKMFYRCPVTYTLDCSALTRRFEQIATQIWHKSEAKEWANMWNDHSFEHHSKFCTHAYTHIKGSPSKTSSDLFPQLIIIYHNTISMSSIRCACVIYLFFSLPIFLLNETCMVHLSLSFQRPTQLRRSCAFVFHIDKLCALRFLCVSK